MAKISPCRDFLIVFFANLRASLCLLDSRGSNPSRRAEIVGSSLLLEKAAIALFCTLWNFGYLVANLVCACQIDLQVPLCGTGHLCCRLCSDQKLPLLLHVVFPVNARVEKVEKFYKIVLDGRVSQATALIWVNIFLQNWHQPFTQNIFKYF